MAGRHFSTGSGRDRSRNIESKTPVLRARDVRRQEEKPIQPESWHDPLDDTNPLEGGQIKTGFEDVSSRSPGPRGGSAPAPRPAARPAQPGSGERPAAAGPRNDLRDRNARAGAERRVQEPEKPSGRADLTHRAVQRGSGASRGLAQALEADGLRLIRLGIYPLLFLWMEVWLHIYMGVGGGYWIIYSVFALAAGLLTAALVHVLPPRAGRITGTVIVWVFAVIFCVEIIARIILQTYYSFSILGTAANNKLGDYANLIFSTVWKNMPIILLMLAAPAGLMIWNHFSKEELERPAWRKGAALAALLAVALHLVGVAAVELPDWKADLSPSYLYHTDTDINDKVGALGLITMLRLDVQHMIFPEKNVRPSNFKPVEVPSSAPSESSASSQESSDGEASQGEATPAPVDTSPNVMNIDLAKMAADTDDEDVAWLANYFSSVTPTKKNRYTGMMKGYNVIFVTLEGFSGYAVDPVLTPTLYKMQHEGVYFKNYYTALHYTSTSNGECQHLLGFYPKNGDPITMSYTGEVKTNTYFSLARQLGRLGYKNYGYHNNEDMYDRRASHENLGYLWHDTEDGMPLETDEYGDDFWPQRDSWMAEVTADEYMTKDEPFNVYYITITGHAPYYFGTATERYEETLDKYDWSDTTKAYMGTAMEVDRMMQVLIEKLTAAGKLENTLIVASPDHVPYADIDVLEELAGETFASSEAMRAIDESNINFEVYRSACFMWSGSMKEPIEVDKVTCQVDLLPTISNLLGLEYDSRMLSGTDALSDSEGLVVFSSRSWKSDRGFYNRFTQEFTPAAGVTMTAEEQEQYVDAMKDLVSYKLEAGPLVVDVDFFDKMLAYQQ